MALVLISVHSRWYGEDVAGDSLGTNAKPEVTRKQVKTVAQSICESTADR